jgi:hypothetical protein
VLLGQPLLLLLVLVKPLLLPVLVVPLVLAAPLPFVLVEPRP